MWGGGGGGGTHVLNVKLWGWGPKLRIIRPHESTLYTIRLVLWGVTTIRCRGKAVNQTSGSVSQCSPIPGDEMIWYFSVQLVGKLGVLSPPNLKSGRA